MAYEYDEFTDAIRFGLTMSDRDTTDDIWKMVDEVVNKAKAWDRLYDMILDEDMTIREFDDEMYELLKQTGKTDIRIITDPSIRMEDE